jgi:hypothetical protein
MANERHLAQTFAERREQARAFLRREMDQRGLLEKDGWRIAETIRPVGSRTELVMRPVHLHFNAPPDLECIVEIDEDETIESNCTP